MKRQLRAWMILGLLFLASICHGEGVEFSLTGLYQFGGATDETTQQEGTFEYGESWGVNSSLGMGLVAGYRVGEMTTLELSWDRQFSALDLHTPEPESGQQIEKMADLSVDYFMVGMNHEFSRSSIIPYVGGAVGLVSMTPDREDYFAVNRFSFAVLTGLRSHLSSSVFLRGNARISVTSIPEGTVFSDDYYHHEETFMTQFQLALGIGVSF